MRELGRGTVLFINGGSAVTPNGNVTGTSVAFAGESAYGQLLHDALVPEGIHVSSGKVRAFGVSNHTPARSTC